MNKEVLEKKIAGLLNIGEEESNFAFSLFKEKLAKFLNVGEAVKIENLGVFQLKEQLGHYDSKSTNEQKGKNLTLVYSPEKGQSIEGSLFINLEISEKMKDETEFDESVFQLGIGKPLAISKSDGDLKNGNLGKSSLEVLENEIDSLLNNSEKLKKFDLWEDYLKTKESKNILPDDSDIDQISELEEVNDVSKELDTNLYEKDFVELDEDEIFDDIVKDNDFIQDEDLNTITEEVTLNDYEIENPIEESESVNENNILSDEELSEEDLPILDEGSENIINEVPKKSVLDEINLELEATKTDDVENIEEQMELENNEVVENEEYSDSIDENYTYGADTSEILTKDEESYVSTDNKTENIETEIPVFDNHKEIKYKKNKRKRKPIIYVLIVAFILVGIAGVYFLFLQNPTWLYDKHEVEVALSEQHVQELEEAKNNANIIKDENNVEPDVKKPENSGVSQVEQKAISQNAQKTQNNIANTEDKEVEDNIYFNGSVYSVQISSWKQKSIAEKELSKVIKKGFPAYIVKIYIPKFKGTWHRVRLGPYNSLNEAQQAQTKIKK